MFEWFRGHLNKWTCTLVVLSAMGATILCVGLAVAVPQLASLSNKLGNSRDITHMEDLAPGQVMRLGRGKVNQIAYAPDGKTLAVATHIGLWLYRLDPPDGGHLLPSGDWVESISWAPDAREIAVGVLGRGVQIWSVSDGRIVRELNVPEGVWGIDAVSWSPDGKYIAATANTISEAGLGIWSASDGHLVHRLVHSREFLRVNTDLAQSASWSPDSRRIAAGSFSGVWIWSVDEEKVLHQLESHSVEKEDVRWSPDGNKIAAASLDHRVQVWSATDGQKLQEFDAPDGSFKTVAWSSDSTRIAAGVARPVGKDRQEYSVRIESLSDGRLVHTFELHGQSVETLSWSPGGQAIASGGNFNDSVRIWSSLDGQLVRELGEHIPEVECVTWSPDGTLVTAGVVSARVWLWSAINGRVVGKVGPGGPTLSRTTVSWSPDGTQFAFPLGDRGKTIQIWSFAENRPYRTVETIVAGNLSYSPDGNYLVSAGEFDRNVRIWSASDGKLVRELPVNADIIHSVSWSPDGSKVAAGTFKVTIEKGTLKDTEKGTVVIWNVSDGQVWRTLDAPHATSVRSVTWSPDGRYLAAEADDDRTSDMNGIYYDAMHIWSVADGQLVRSLNERPRHILSVSWSPDGSRIAVAAAAEVWIVSPTNGQVLRKLAGHTAEIQSVSWSPDGKRLASGSYDGTILVWNVDEILQSVPPTPATR